MDSAPACGRKCVSNAVPPEPQFAVDEAGGDERRDRAIEFSEERRGHRRVIQIAIIDRKCHRPAGHSSLLERATQELFNGENVVPGASQMSECAADRARVVALMWPL